MKIFANPNLSNKWKCPICGTNKDIPVILIPVYGTEEGNNMQARQYHVDCIDLMERDLPNGQKIIYQACEE